MECIVTITVAPAFEGKRVYRLEREFEKGGRPHYTVSIDSGFTSYGYPSEPAVRQQSIDTAFVESLISELENTPINICPESVWGLDGTTTTIEIIRGFNSVSFTWWGELPEQWKNLRKVFELFDA